MIFRQLFDKESSTYSYLLADEKTKDAVLIDSVIEQVQRDTKIIKELNLNLLYLLETHVHADHITGMSELKNEFIGAKSVVHLSGGVECADIFVKDGDNIKFGDYSILVLETPGHTNGDLCFYVDGKVFTGDTLLIRGCGRTDFQSGCPEKMYQSVMEKLFTLPDDTSVYPAHDYKGLNISTIYEERNLNPRLANKTLKEFVQIMSELKLAEPKKIREAVPANLRCGKILNSN